MASPRRSSFVSSPCPFSDPGLSPAREGGGQRSHPSGSALQGGHRAGAPRQPFPSGTDPAGPRAGDGQGGLSWTPGRGLARPGAVSRAASRWAPSPQHPLVQGGLFPAVNTSVGPGTPGRAGGRGERLRLGMREDVPHRVSIAGPVGGPPRGWAAGEVQGQRRGPAASTFLVCGRPVWAWLSEAPGARTTQTGRLREGGVQTPTRHHPPRTWVSLNVTLGGVGGFRPGTVGVGRRGRRVCPEPTASRAEDRVGSWQDGVGAGSWGRGSRPWHQQGQWEPAGVGGPIGCLQT